MTLPLGLLSWLLSGTVTGLVARGTLPGRPRMGLVAALLVGIWGALLGGVLATWLGFGGLLSYDTRSVVTAVLASVFLLLVVRAASLR